MRWWVVGLGLVVLVMLGTAGCQHAEPSTKVVVSAQDIPAGTHMDRLIAAGDFRTIEVPDSTIVSGAITSVDQLRGRTTAATIYANEQIPTFRLEGIP